MLLAPIDWAIIAVYVVFTLVIGLYYKNRASKSLSDFFLSGRNLPWIVAGLSMVATTFAADTPLAVTELVVKNGISGNWLWWNFLIGGMLTTIFFAHLWRRAEVLTEVELLRIRYSGKVVDWLRGFKAVYLGLFMNGLIIAWVNLAMMTIIKVFFNVNGQMLFWIIAAAMVISVLYSALSGLWGVAVTDVVQFVIAMSGSIILAILVLHSQKIGGIEGLKAQLPKGALEFFPRISATKVPGVLAITFGSFLAYGLIQWWASWYPGSEPGGGGYIAQRMMSTRNEKHSIYATLLFQVSNYALRPWPWILVALSAIVLYPHLHEARLGYVYIMRDYLPVGLRGLLLVAFLAAYMSTISTQLNFGASILTNDFYLVLFKNKQLSKRQQVNAARILTVILMIVALYLTTRVKTITGVWKFVLECGAGLGLVLILRWYWWRVNAWSEFTAMVVPFIGYSLSKFVLHLHFPDSYFFTVGLTTIAWIGVTLLTKPVDNAVLESFYTKVKPGGWWKPVKELTDVDGEHIGINKFIAWISAVIMGYGALFLIGAIILHMWTQVYWYSAMMLGGMTVFAFSFNPQLWFKRKK